MLRQACFVRSAVSVALQSVGQQTEAQLRRGDESDLQMSDAVKLKREGQKTRKDARHEQPTLDQAHDAESMPHTSASYQHHELDVQLQQTSDQTEKIAFDEAEVGMVIRMTPESCEPCIDYFIGTIIGKRGDRVHMR